jgi:phosphopentomutase
MRIIVVILDGVGVGELPDARLYGDEGSNTLGNTAVAMNGLELPALERLGLGRVIPVRGVTAVPARRRASAGWPRSLPGRTASPATGS